MRKTAYITKSVSDSIIGLALLASPLSYFTADFDVLAPATFHDEEATSAADDGPPHSQTSMGRFFEYEIERRIERLSGRTFADRAERSRKIASSIAEASYLFNVDPFLLLAMIEVESRYDQYALGRHGEIGLMQIKPSTARWVAPVTDALWDCDLREIHCNIMTGARYVGHLQDRIEKRRGQNGAPALSTASLFREHVLRSYNLGPAKANRLAFDREPALAGKALPYATKIANRSDRMRSRYLTAAVESKQPMDRAPQSITASFSASMIPSLSTVALAQ